MVKLLRKIDYIYLMHLSRSDKLKNINIKIIKTFIVVALIFGICPQIVNAQTQIPVTRGQAEQRALNIINLRWFYSQTRNGRLSSEYWDVIWQPSQLHGITTQLMRGIPYNWGGFDSLDSKSDDAPWGNFMDAINKGAYAGNVNTDYNYGYIEGTAGIDCSGFIQAAFNIKSSAKLSTTTMFDKYFYKIPLKDITHMDILNKSAWHVAVFDRWGTYKGVYGAFTYEATPEHDYGGIEGTKRYFMTMADINTGYVPGRYVNIVENPPLNPILSSISEGGYAKPVNVINEAYFRASPSSSSTIIGSIPIGSALYLQDVYYGWYKVTYEGKVGWLSGQLLGPIQSGVYASVIDVSKLNIRTSPSLSGQIMGMLYKNDNVEIVDYSSDNLWWKIRYNDTVGWVSSYYLKYLF